MSTYILGISAFYHDSAACLIKDGEIVAAAQEERFTRRKHDASFPAQAVGYCLRQAGIDRRSINYVAYYEKPLIKFERILLTYLAYAPRGIRSFLQAMPVWLNQKLFLKDYLREQLQFEGEMIFTEHHEAHAASAFYPSPFADAAILTMDGVGEWATSSFGTGEDNRIELLAEQKFPHSPGLLYSAFTYYAGFRVNSGEYKLMGLAPYGEPRYVDLIKKELLDLKDDGSFKLNMKYFDYCAGLTMTNDRFHKLFKAPPRQPETPIRPVDRDVARSIQAVTEDIIVKMADHVHEQTKKENLCLAGGVALNCVANGKILNRGRFKRIWIQPAAGDAGGALGAALFVWYRYSGNPRRSDNVHDAQKGSCLGPEFTDGDMEECFRTTGAVYEKLEWHDLTDRIARLIAEEKVVGLCQGRMEFGPRALGARSIVADARSLKMQSLLNLKIKFRESFRPFAPSVLEEKGNEFFELTGPSPYMLLTAPVRGDKIREDIRDVPANSTDDDILERLKIPRSVIPAVTHVDYSARVQTVSRESHPAFYEIIEKFFKLTGCPVIINTSFNVRGEPIVCSPSDAYRCFMCTDMDYLVAGNYILDKTRQPQPKNFKREHIALGLD